MFPHERSLVRQLANKPFVLIGVNSDNDLESIRKTVKEKNISWRSFWNGPSGPGGPIAAAWGVQSWPTIYVLDATGKIRFINVRGEGMSRAIESLLKEMNVEVKLEEPNANDEVPAKPADGP